MTIIFYFIVLLCWNVWQTVCPASATTEATETTQNIIKPTETIPTLLSQLTVRSDWNYPPFEYLNTNGDPEGFNIDIIQAIGRVMNIKIKIDLGPWDEVRQQLENGKIDAIAGMFRTIERDKLVDFSIPHFIVSYAVFVRDDSDISSIEDIQDKTILVQNKDLGHDYVLENRIGEKIITRQNWDDVLKLLSKGQGDCAIVSRLQGIRLIKDLKLTNIHPVGAPIIQRKYCIAVKEGDSNLLFVINEGLSIIKTTGEYDRIYEKWFDVYESSSITFSRLLEFALWASIPIALLTFLVISWTWSLRRQVKSKTNHFENELNERRKTEVALRESEERYRRLTENAQDVIFRMSLPDGRYEYVNEASVSIFGYTPQEVLSQPLLIKELIHPDSQAFFKTAWENLLQGKAPKTYEYKTIDRNGKTRSLFQRNVLVHDEEGKLIAIEGIVTDITNQKAAEKERKQLEVQLHRAEKMETIGMLAGGVAHDLNNVLGAIVGYPDLLLQEIPSDSPMKKGLNAIKDSGEKAALIVQDLLTLARRSVSVSEVVNLNEVVSAYLKSREYQRLVETTKNIKVEGHLDPNLLNIIGSPVHLSKIIMNLVQNSKEAMSDGGIISLTTENIYLDRAVKGYDTVAQGDYIRLTVSDNGMGISPKDLERIFEPFYTRKTMGQSGSGLGMAIVWRAVKDHKGYIDIGSEQDKGTTVKIYFPVTRQEPATDSPQHFELSDYHGNNETILVIDDIDSQRDVATSILQKANYQVVTAASGEAALKYLENKSVDLLLLDMIMDDGMDGLETYEQILKKHPGQKAIIASGYSETERVRETQKLGAGAYIKKPFTLEVLVKTVKAELKR